MAYIRLAVQEVLPKCSQNLSSELKLCNSGLCFSVFHNFKCFIPGFLKDIIVHLDKEVIFQVSISESIIQALITILLPTMS